MVLIYCFSAFVYLNLQNDPAQPHIDEATLAAAQQMMAQQAAFAQIPDVVKRVCVLAISLYSVSDLM